MLQDFGRRHRGCWSPSGLLDIGNVTLDLFGILIIQGHGPEFFTDGLTCGDDLITELLVVTEQARHDRAERNDDPTRERRHIYNR